MSKSEIMEIDKNPGRAINTIMIAILVICASLCKASQTPYSKLSISELMDMGKIQLLEADRPDSALEIYKEVIRRYSDKLNDEEKGDVITALNNSGYILSNHSENLEEAFKKYDRGRRICEENPQINGKFALLGLNMANLFMRYDELTADTIYEKDAKMILSHAFDDAIKTKKWELGVQIFINLTASEFNSKDLARIIAITEKFDTLHIPSETRLLRFARQRAKGIHALANGNIEEAIIHFQKQADFIDPLLDVQRYKVQVIADLAECQRFTNNSDLELKFLQKIDSIALTENLTDLRLSSARQLAQFYSEKGNASMAKNWNYRYYTLRDSIYPSGIPTLRDHPSMKDEITRINARQNEKVSSNKSYTSIGITVLVLLAILIIGGGIMFVNRRRCISQHNFEKDICKNNESQISEIPPVVSRKYRTSPLQDQEKLHLAETINRCLSESNEIYSSDFSLNKLAELCNSRPAYVSQSINECMNKNFNTLVNSYRIQAACKRMKEEAQAYTIESISAAVGFKSRSSFVAAFKKEKGMTPSEYLKTNSKG